MIPQKFAEHCKSIKAVVDFSTFGPRQKKNIYKMVKTAKFGSAWNESPTTVIAKSIFDQTKQPYFQIQGDAISMYFIPPTHPIVEELKAYYALCKLMPREEGYWAAKPDDLYNSLIEFQKSGQPISSSGYWDGFRIDLHRKYGEPETPEFKAILNKIKAMAVFEMADDSPAVIKAQQILDGEVTEMTFNYNT